MNLFLDLVQQSVQMQITVVNTKGYKYMKDNSEKDFLASITIYMNVFNKAECQFSYYLEG